MALQPFIVRDLDPAQNQVAPGAQRMHVVTLAAAGSEPVTFEPWPAWEDPEISGLEDGQYKYELYLVPYVTKRRAGSVVRGETDENGRVVAMGGNLRTRAELPPRRVQSGAFTVLYGEMVDPYATE